MIARGTLVQLLRAPAALSVPGDGLAGAAAAGRPTGPAAAGLATSSISSICLYWAGMALNDYADRHVDAVERPARPIPSGRVRPRAALGIAGGLTVAGLGAAALADGRRALGVAAPLAATVWAYDLALKNTAAGPATMATARALDVLVGAGLGRLRPAAPAALTVGVHTLAVTTLSRSEVTGGNRTLPLGTLLATAGVTAVTAGCDGDVTGAAHPAAVALPSLPPLPLVAWAALATYATTVGRAQAAATREPTPARVQRAVGAGILGTIPLQAALAGRAGAPRTAAAILATFPLARALARRVSPT